MYEHFFVKYLVVVVMLLSSMMEQDDLEEQVLYQSLLNHLELLRKIVLHHPGISQFLRPEILLVVVFLVFLQSGRWMLQSSVSEGMSILGGHDVSWSDSTGRIFIHATQGKRPSMEDRFLSYEVTDPGEPGRSLRINAILDGHGGEFAADYVRSYLIEELSRKLRGLLLLSNFKSSARTLGTTQAVQLLEKCQKVRLSKGVLASIGVSLGEYQSMSLLLPSQDNPEEGENSKKPESTLYTLRTSEEPLSFGSSSTKTPQRSNSPASKTSRVKRTAPLPPPLKTTPQSSPANSERVKFISEAAPSSPDDLTPNELSVNTSFFVQSKKPSPGRGRKAPAQKQQESEACLSEYLSSNKSILYPKLLRKEINNVDSHLIKLSKEKYSYSGTTLIISILDDSNLWVANVGDSRGVLLDEKGSTIPLSYDHKPSQLKEKKRIEEAGGFVSMNGVWRVQGILATSRALGDFPLKDNNLIVCDPDILSFSLEEHRPRFMVLASDGLWDTHSNEEATKIILRVSSGIGGIKAGLKYLCNDALDKGSLDNVTVLVYKF